MIWEGIGDANAAARLEADGEEALATIQRLTPAEALDALDYLSGAAPRQLDDALGFACRESVRRGTRAS